mgnify:CR=1 FL=1
MIRKYYFSVRMEKIKLKERRKKKSNFTHRFDLLELFANQIIKPRFDFSKSDYDDWNYHQKLQFVKISRVNDDTILIANL